MQLDFKEADLDVGFPSTPALSFFTCPPDNVPRQTQVQVINEIERAMRDGNRFIILEAPVGSGKSPIAVTLANFFGSAHILTPQKSLQDQYYEDFHEHVVTMKGRNAYPCRDDDMTPSDYHETIRLIHEGSSTNLVGKYRSCAEGGCRNSRSYYQSCVRDYPCPYSEAIDVAIQNRVVVHNLHSFIFQTNFAGKFDQRKLLVIDEAHQIEDIIRGFITKKVRVAKNIPEEEWKGQLAGIEDWIQFFLKEDYVPEESNYEKVCKQQDEDYMSEKDKYLEQIQIFQSNAEYFSGGYSVKHETETLNTGPRTTFEFIPHSLGTAPSNLLFQFGEYVLLMSGTIYDKNVYCRSLGINPDDAYFIRIPSNFPAKMRPIYCKSEYQIDTSFAQWNDNFHEMCGILNRIADKFHDVKGLIHTPSYQAAWDIASNLPKERAVTHNKGDLVQSLESFFASDKPLIFVSPVCQQGVDFKGDRGRFQIIVRVPYLNTSDEFVNDMVQTNFPWYNHQALVTFGQQIGRINRSPDDFGATFCLDSRFNRFIQRNSTKLPQWLRNAIKY